MNRIHHWLQARGSTVSHGKRQGIEVDYQRQRQCDSITIGEIHI